MAGVSEITGRRVSVGILVGSFVEVAGGVLDGRLGTGVLDGRLGTGVLAGVLVGTTIPVAVGEAGRGSQGGT